MKKFIHIFFITDDLDEIKQYKYPDPVKYNLDKLSWLIGCWQSVSAEIFGESKITSFSEQIQFSFTGQACINFRTRSWNPITKMPMHFESGYLRVQPGTDTVSLVSSHNFGVTSIEEGVLVDNIIMLKSKSLSRMSFAKPPKVTQLDRTFQLMSDGSFQIKADMATEGKVCKKHMTATYKRIESRKSQV